MPWTRIHRVSSTRRVTRCLGLERERVDREELIVHMAMLPTEQPPAPLRPRGRPALPPLPRA